MSDTTLVDNAILQDSRLSWRARGVAVFILSQSDDFCISVENLSAASGSDGRTSIRRALAELEKYGYFVRRRVRRADGTITYESILIENPSMVDGLPIPVDRSTIESGSGGPGFLYLIRDDGPGPQARAGLVKIGVTGRDVFDRMRQIEKSWGAPLSLLAVIELASADDSVIAEQYLHDYYSDRAVGGEWFHFDYSEIETLAGWFHQWHALEPSADDLISSLKNPAAVSI